MPSKKTKQPDQKGVKWITVKIPVATGDIPHARTPDYLDHAESRFLTSDQRFGAGRIAEGFTRLYGPISQHSLGAGHVLRHIVGEIEQAIRDGKDELTIAPAKPTVSQAKPAKPVSYDAREQWYETARAWQAGAELIHPEGVTLGKVCVDEGIPMTPHMLADALLVAGLCDVDDDGVVSLAQHWAYERGPDSPTLPPGTRLGVIDVEPGIQLSPREFAECIHRGVARQTLAA